MTKGCHQASEDEGKPRKQKAAEASIVGRTNSESGKHPCRFWTRWPHSTLEGEPCKVHLLNNNRCPTHEWVLILFSIQVTYSNQALLVKQMSLLTNVWVTEAAAPWSCPPQWGRGQDDQTHDITRVPTPSSPLAVTELWGGASWVPLWGGDSCGSWTRVCNQK